MSGPKPARNPADKPATARVHPAGFLAAEDYHFSGYATPADALASFYWALDKPGSGRLLDALALPPDVLAAMAKKSGAAGPANIGIEKRVIGPEAGFAPHAAAAGDGGSDQDPAGDPESAPGRRTPFLGHRVVSDTEIDPDTHELEVERELADGGTMTEKQTLTKVGGNGRFSPAATSRSALSRDPMEAHP